MATRKPLVLIAGAVQELPSGDDLGFTPENVAAKDASGGYPGLTLFKLNLRNAANTITSWFTTAATAARTWTMPDKDGTVAMTSDIHDATSKTTPVDADEIGLVDSAASNVLKKLTWANLKATLKTYLDTLYALKTGSTSTIFSASGVLIGVASDIYIYESSSGVLTLRTGTAGGGYKYFSFSTDGNFTTLSGSVATTGGMLVTGASLLGYGTGAGGTVTQATDKLTSVTLNKPCGRITMHNSALAAGASVNFPCNNSLITDGNVVVVITGYFGAVNPSSYSFSVLYPLTGGIVIKVTNITAGSLSEAVQFNFAIIKGATA